MDGGSVEEGGLSKNLVLAVIIDGRIWGHSDNWVTVNCPLAFARRDVSMAERLTVRAETTFAPGGWRLGISDSAECFCVER